MPDLLVDIIEWDGRYICTLAPPFTFTFEPGYNQQYEPVVDLIGVYSETGKILAMDDYPLESMTSIHTETVQAWQNWEKQRRDSLLRHPAERIYCRPGYPSPIQAENPHQIIQRVCAIDPRRYRKWQ